MKSFSSLVFLVSVSILLFSCSHGDETFRWLEGTWKVDMKSDVEPVFHEQWEWNDEKGIMTGKGFEVLGKDTSWFETLSIEKMKDNWFYRAHVPSEHGKDTINFLLLTKADSDSLVFNNDENTFPGTIQYIKRNENKLTIVLISAANAIPAAEYRLDLVKIPAAK
jgi:hypothetical protein